MKYTDFVKAHFHKLPANMSAKEKMKKIAELWRAQKGQAHAQGQAQAHAHARSAKGAGVFGSIGNAVDGVGSLFGLGLEKHKKKGRGRPRKSAKGGSIENPEGAGIFGSIGDAVDGVGSLFGLGLEKHKKGRGRPRKSAKGGAILYNGEIIPNEHYGKRFGGCHCQHNNELMRGVAELRKTHAQGGGLGDILKKVAPILPLLAL